MSALESSMPNPSHDQTTLLAAIFGGSALAGVVGWLSGAFKWIFGTRERKQSAEEHLLDLRKRQIDDLVDEVRSAGEERADQRGEIEALRNEVGELRAARIADIDQNKQALVALTQEMGTKHAAELRAARLEHEATLAAVTRQRNEDRAQYQEDRELWEATERALREENSRLRQEVRELRERLTPAVRPDGGNGC
jgi:cell division protein FtsB